MPRAGAPTPDAVGNVTAATATLPDVVKEALQRKPTVRGGEDEDDGGGGNPPTGGSDDGRDCFS
ncbi:hypothetical protein OG229_12595 [Streptomyces platensis]|uniref:hypothetical protein n=1 Tax=Streptomyces platensis TaxID=58346 RepID=UPI002E109BD8|nr:hypothetical protein OG229_12595 [Streptomyces platensis]